MMLLAAARFAGSWFSGLLISKQIANGFGAFQAIADGGEVARAAAAKCQASQGALKVRHRLKPAPQIVLKLGHGFKMADLIKARLDCRNLIKGLPKPVCEQTRPCRRDREVNDRKKASFLFARKLAGEFQVRPRCRIDLQSRLSLFLAGNAKMRNFSDLRQQNIIEKASEAGDLRARESPEAVKSQNTEMVPEALIRRGAVKARGGLRAQRNAACLQNPLNGFIAPQAVAENNLARLQPRQFRRQPFVVREQDGKFAGRNLGPGKRHLLRAPGDGKGCNIVAGSRFKQRIFRKRARRDKPDDASADN